VDTKLQEISAGIDREGGHARLPAGSGTQADP